MADAINGMTPFPSGALGRMPSTLPSARQTTAPGGVSFQDVFLKSLEQVNQVDQQAQGAIEVGLTNGDLTQAEVFTAMKKADLAYRTMLQIRNKVMDAYHEIQQLRM